jgi:hypothetical protein
MMCFGKATASPFDHDAEHDPIVVVPVATVGGGEARVVEGGDAGSGARPPIADGPVVDEDAAP